MYLALLSNYKVWAPAVLCLALFSTGILAIFSFVLLCMSCSKINKDDKPSLITRYANILQCSEGEVIKRIRAGIGYKVNGDKQLNYLWGLSELKGKDITLSKHF